MNIDNIARVVNFFWGGRGSRHRYFDSAVF